ncbi:hypothetical protein KPK_2135 [Klebsiella variicola]|uniref:Uncharacterized protein n=1 Tax=Klebsiella variicola (strain 342) TaxID=507522 RepID=B5XQC3_KLEV3|nr:hypothetical protein KPK_2135 [Klebsiella variicola]
MAPGGKVMFLRDLQRSLYFHYEIKIVSGAVLFKKRKSK